MKSRSVCGLAIVAVLLTGCGESGTAALSGPVQAETARGSTRLPTCNGASDCIGGTAVCTGEDGTATVAPTLFTEQPNGITSDGRGPYVQGSDGVRYSVVLYLAVLSFEKASKSIKNPRRYTVNLNNPVPGGGGIALGTIADGSDTQIEIQWQRIGDARQNLHNIPIGTTVTANQMNVGFHLNGHYHILQMGPQPYGHCYSAPNAIVGTGTSTGTIYRASATKWVVDLPAGSVGRLFDIYNTAQYAVDKGLYYFQMHYEIGN